jgi:hypothetical protein
MPEYSQHSSREFVLEAHRARDQFLQLVQTSALHTTEIKAQTKEAISQSHELMSRVDALLGQSSIKRTS